MIVMGTLYDLQRLELAPYDKVDVKSGSGGLEQSKDEIPNLVTVSDFRKIHRSHCCGHNLLQTVQILLRLGFKS